MSKQYFLEYESPYRDACPTHPQELAEWRYSEFFNQHVPSKCPKCIYETRKQYIVRNRTLGRLGRLEEKKKRREFAINVCNTLKELYSNE